MHAFVETDEAKMDELEKKENEVDPELAKSLSSFFGGNPFGSVVPRRAPIKNPQPPQTPEPKKTEPQAMHFHIYNDNKNTQNIELPLSALQTASAPQYTKEKTDTPQGIAPNLKWEQVEIKFNNGNDVTISYGGKQMQSNYEKMGFEDAKSGRRILNGRSSNTWQSTRGLSASKTQNRSRAISRVRKRK